MKKILILVSLVALVASGLFAQVTFTGKIRAASQLPADADGKYLFKTDHAAELQANIKADDANSAVLKVVESTQTNDSPVKIDRAHFTTDYLKAFGLGMDSLVVITGNYGYNEFARASVGNVTSYDTTKKFVRKFTTWGMAQSVEVLKMVKLTGAFDVNAQALTNFFVDGVVTVPSVGPGTVKAELAYTAVGIATEKYGEGHFHAEAAYEMTGLATGLTVAPGVGVAITLKDKIDDGLAGGVKVAYDTALFGVYANGGVIMTIVDANELKADNITRVPLAFGASYSKIVGLDLGAYLDLSAEEAARGAKLDGSGAQGTFDSLDISAWFAAGKGNFRVGYLYVPAQEVALDTLNAVNADGPSRGLYFKATLEF
jgi:hypothetical protein